MRRRIRIAFLAAASLLGGAAMLMHASEEPRSEPTARSVEFPRWMKTAEVKRSRSRRTLPPLPVVTQAPDADPPKPRDPFLVALPRGPDRPLVVLEANALRHSRLGELFVDCVLRTSKKDPFEEMRRETGIDPLKDIDRVAVTSDGLVASGFFDRARLDRLEADSLVTTYGDQGRLYEPRQANSDAKDQQLQVGTWRGTILILGSRPFIVGAIDQMEGRTPDGPSPIPEELTYGEAYGVVPGAAFQRLFTGAQAELGRRLASVATQVELHVDAMRDVALVARVAGPDAGQLDDLGKSFGTALSLLRLDAKVRGSTEIAEMLEHARVERGRKGFSIEVALPIEVVERWFDRCGTTAPAAGNEREGGKNLPR